MKKDYIYGIKGILYVIIISFLIYLPKIFFSLEEDEIGFPWKDVIYVAALASLYISGSENKDKLRVLEKEQRDDK